MEKNSWDDIGKRRRASGRRRKREEETPLPKATLPIESLQDYALDAKGQQDVVFVRKLEEQGKNATVRNLPPMTEVLSYIAKLEKQPPWFLKSQESIVNSNALKFPEIDVLSRTYIADFMREPHNASEPLCSNPTCESERLGGFRIRALVTPNQQLNNWCYLCHLFFTNRLYFESLNRKHDNQVYQIHHFAVRVDEPGEYRLDMTLMGEQNVQGIFGPFPLYNCHNYTPTHDGRCRGWIESDVMVFRLSQTMPSNPTGSSCTTDQGSALRPSSPIGFQPPSFGSP